MYEHVQIPTGTPFADGRYTILRRLAEGGMGAVYVAVQRSTSHERALKLLRPELDNDPRMQRLFEQEARIGARIASDHVVQVVDAGFDTQTHTRWLAMELLDGQDLASRLREGGALSLKELGLLFAQLCHALGRAHQQNIVHRDLKPANIFLAKPRQDNAPFFVKILDFGLAKIIAQSAQASMDLGAVGTPAWMAPEQVTGSAPIAPYTDVWALGLIAFRAITGYHYLRTAEDPDGNPLSLAHEIKAGPLPAATLRARECGAETRLPAGFDAWLARCLSRDVHARFANASVAFAALREVLEGGAGADFSWARTPVPDGSGGLPPGGDSQSDGPARGRRLLLGLAAAGLGVSVLLFGWQLSRHLAERPLRLCAADAGTDPAALQRRLQACHEACGHGSAESCVYRGDLMLRHRTDGMRSAPEAQRSYQQACERGVPEGCERLARIYLDGAPGLEPDRNHAVSAYGQLCSYGRKAACQTLGAIYRDHKIERASAFLRRACDAGQSEPCAILKAVKEQAPAPPQPPPAPPGPVPGNPPDSEKTAVRSDGSGPAQDRQSDSNSGTARTRCRRGCGGVKPPTHPAVPHSSLATECHQQGNAESCYELGLQHKKSGNHKEASRAFKLSCAGKRLGCALLDPGTAQEE